jgi:hypothetical protein
VDRSPAAAALADAERRLKQQAVDLKLANNYRASALYEVKALSTERHELVKEHERLAVKLKLAAQHVVELIKEHAVQLKAHTVEVRSWKMEVSKVVADASGLEEALFEAVREKQEAVVRAEAAEVVAAEARSKLDEAEEALDEATEAAMEAETEAAAQLDAEKRATEGAEYAEMLSNRREARAKAKAAKLASRLKAIAETNPRSADEWASLSREATWKASQRDRRMLKQLMSNHFSASDISSVLGDLSMVESVFNSPEFFEVFFARVEKISKDLESTSFGVELSLFLHYELLLTLPKILSITQAACKRYNRPTDSYLTKSLLPHRYRKNKFVKVPRLCPPVARLVPIIRSIEKRLGVNHSDNGAIAYTGITEVMQDLMARDCGRFQMPQLSSFSGGKLKLPIVIQFDGTGYGMLAINTAVVRNPYLPQTSQQLRPIGVGKCKDDKEGTTRLLAGNLAAINGWVANEHDDVCSSFTDGGKEVEVMPNVYSCLDLAALRHCEHVAKSGFCGCDADFALRTTPPTKPDTVAEMHTASNKCVSHKRDARFILSHNPRPGHRFPTSAPPPAATLLTTEVLPTRNIKTSLLKKPLFSSTSQRQVGINFRSGEWRMRTSI